MTASAAPADPPAAVATQALGYTYRSGSSATDALVDLSIATPPGTVLAVVGPSGSGKSTLLRLLCGLSGPTSGRVLIAGRDVTGTPPERRPVAMVFQGFALFPHLTVRDNIAFGPRVRREPKARTQDRLEEAVTALDIDRLLDRYPSELSGGERQRTALARALVRQPAVFCLDEPLSSLDPVLRADARRLLGRLLRTDGRCAVYVTHDQSEAMTVGDRVAILRAGRLEQLGSPREVYDSPATAFVASFVGTPPMSLVPVSVAGRLLDPGRLPAGAATIGLRAEDLTLADGDDATVTAVEDLGHETHCVVDLDGTVVLVRLSRPDGVRPGSRVGLRADPAGIRVFAESGLSLAGLR